MVHLVASNGCKASTGNPNNFMDRVWFELTRLASLRLDIMVQYFLFRLCYSSLQMLGKSFLCELISMLWSSIGKRQLLSIATIYLQASFHTCGCLHQSCTVGIQATNEMKPRSFSEEWLDCGPSANSPSPVDYLSTTDP